MPPRSFNRMVWGLGFFLSAQEMPQISFSPHETASFLRVFARASGFSGLISVGRGPRRIGALFNKIVSRLSNINKFPIHRLSKPKSSKSWGF